MHEAVITRTSTKLRNSFLFRFRRRENHGFHHNFPVTHKGYNSAAEFIIIGQSRHEKDLVLCLMRILARCVEVLRQFDFPLKGRSELFEPRRGEF